MLVNGIKVSRKSPAQEPFVIELWIPDGEFADPLIQQRWRPRPTIDTEVAVHSDHQRPDFDDEGRIELSGIATVGVVASNIANT